MFCVEKYTENFKQVVVRNVESGICSVVFPDTIVNMVTSGENVCFKLRDAHNKVSLVKYREFAQRVFASKGFETNPMVFGDTFLILVRPRKVTNKTLEFLSSFVYSNWNVNVFAVPVEEYRNILKITDIALRRGI